MSQPQGTHDFLPSRGARSSVPIVMELLPVLDNSKWLELEHAKPKAKVVESGADGLIEHREITKPRSRRSAHQVSSRATRRFSAHDNGQTGNAADESSAEIVLA